MAAECDSLSGNWSTSRRYDGEMTKLALLDGHSLAYRAFYALPPDLATPSGQVTNAVFGFTSMLIKLLDDEAPDAMAVAWDRKEPTFRSAQYPEYKANRESAISSGARCRSSRRFSKLCRFHR